MTTIQVKCYLFSNLNVSVSAKLQSEIRIFNLTYQSWNGIYTALVNKIRSAYESILNKGDDIKVYWQDDEDELVCFSSDDELRYAINIFKTMNQKAIRKKPESTSNHFLRIYIARKNSNDTVKSHKSERSKSSKTVCNDSENCTIGETYKCNECTDTQMCDSCSKKFFHKSHTATTKEKSTQQDKPKYQSLCPKKLTTLLTSANQSVPIVKNDDQLKYAGEVLKKLFDPYDINVAYQSDTLNKTLKSAMKIPTKEIAYINTDPDQLKRIGENIRNFLDARGIEAVYSIQNSICCNGCSEQINGVRYKCSQCIDYDLCETCEKKGIHKEHRLVKVAKKSDQSSQMNNFKYCFSCNDPIIGSRYKCNTCLNHDICEICERKGVQKPHMFMRVPSTDNNQDCKLIRNNSKTPTNKEPTTIAVQQQQEIKPQTPYNVKIDSRSSATPGVRFKFSSRLSYNFSENKDNRMFSRSQSRLETSSSSVEEVKVNRINLNNKIFPLSEYYEKTFNTKSVYSSSGSNLSTDTLSPARKSDLVLDEAFNMIRSSSKLNLKTKPNLVNQNIDLKVLKLQKSASKSNNVTNANNTVASSRNVSSIGQKRQIITNTKEAKENESFIESDYENYSKKNDRDRLNLSSFSSDVNSAFDSDIDIDKEFRILDTIDRLRSLGYEGTWVKKLVNAKNGNFNLVLESINQRPAHTWSHHNPKTTSYRSSTHIPSNSYRL